jgi:hypothetical protein
MGFCDSEMDEYEKCNGDGETERETGSTRYGHVNQELETYITLKETRSSPLTIHSARRSWSKRFLEEPRSKYLYSTPLAFGESYLCIAPTASYDFYFYFLKMFNLFFGRVLVLGSRRAPV